MSLENTPAKSSSKDNTFDRITSYYLEGRTLTPKQEEIRVRWDAAWTMMHGQFNSPGQTAKKLKGLYGGSVARAYRDVRNAQLLFGEVTSAGKEGKRAIIYEMAMRNYQLAATQNPPNLTEMNKATSIIAKVTGLDRDDSVGFDPATIAPHKFVMAFNPESLGFEKLPNVEELLARFKKKTEPTIDVDAEVIEDE